MIEITPFSQSGLGIEALHPAMLDAFSDYIIPLQPGKDALMALLQARGFDPDASFVALEGGQVAAFWAVATRGPRRYLIVSGTKISHRGMGLSYDLGRAAIESAGEAGCHSLSLEVIAGNTKAEGLYGKLGFEAVRGLNCYRLDHPTPHLSPCRITSFEQARDVFQRYATWEPTWQNAAETISHLDLTCFLHAQGAAIVGEGGDVYQIAAANPAALGELIAAAATIGPLQLINIDAKDLALNAHLTTLGADRFVEQREMRVRVC